MTPEEERKVKSFQRAVESARNGIVMTDPNQPDNPIIYVNKAFLEISGYDESEVLGRNCRFLQGEDHTQEGLAVVRQALKNGESCLALLRNYRKDGTLFWNELYISPVHDDAGNIINFVGIQNDVSARKEAEKRVSEFYSMISHELRTPLTSIMASLEIVISGDAGATTPQTERLTRIALKNTSRLLKLVDDVLDLKKLESGKLDLALKAITPQQAINEVVESLKELAAPRDIKLVPDIRSKLACVGDIARVNQVLTNLVGNAVKFAPEHSQVTITAETKEGRMRFAVTDEGPGISAEDQPKLFGKFQQLDSSDTRPQQGSGLGLAISKLLVELQGGEIGVTSYVGTGSTFWFDLPLVKGKAVTLS